MQFYLCDSQQIKHIKTNITDKGCIEPNTDFFCVWIAIEKEFWYL